MQRSDAYPSNILMHAASGTDIDTDFDEYTDSEIPDQFPFQLPLPEYTQRRLSGYSSQDALNRRLSEEFDSTRLEYETLLQDRIQHPEKYKSGDLPNHLHDSFNNIMQLTYNEAIQYVNKNENLWNNEDKNVLEQHIHAAFTAQQYAQDTISSHLQRLQNDSTFNTVLIPSNLDDPLAWAAMPIQEQLRDNPNSTFSRTLAMQKALADKDQNVLSSLQLFDKANPFNYAQNAAQFQFSHNLLIDTPDGEEFAAKVKQLSDKPARSHEELIRNQQEFQNLVTMQQFAETISDLNQQIITFQHQLQQDTKTPRLNARSTDSTKSSDVVANIGLLPSERHQIMVDLSNLKYQKSSLEQHYKAQARKQGKLWSSESGETTYDANTDNDGYTDGDSTDDDFKPQNTTNNHSYWSYLNPWAYGNANISTSSSGLSNTAQLDFTSDSETDSTSNGHDIDTRHDIHSRSKSSSIDQPFVFPTGYDVQLPNRDYLHLDLANLSPIDQTNLKYREILEDFVHLFFASPQFTTQHWDEMDINHFVALYNNQEDSRWNIYSQLLQSWYSNQFPTAGVVGVDLDETKISSNAGDQAGINSSTWNHLSPELKDFKAMMDLQFLGLCKQYLSQSKKIDSIVRTHSDHFAPLNDDDIVIETGEILSKLQYIISTRSNPGEIENDLKNILRSGQLPPTQAFIALSYFNQLSSNEIVSLPNKFQCMKEFIIHLFNTHRLQDDYRLLVDIDMSGLYSSYENDKNDTLDKKQENNENHKNYQKSKSPMQFIFLDPYKNTSVLDLPIPQDIHKNQTGHNNPQFYLCTSPSSSLQFDPKFQQKILHWSQKPWASAIISQRRQFLTQSGIDTQTDDFGQFSTKQSSTDSTQPLSNAFPGDDNYFDEQQRYLHNIQTNLDLPATELPPAIKHRIQTAHNDSNGTSIQLSREEINNLWEEDKKTLNLFILAQQQQKFNNDALFQRILLNKSLSSQDNYFFSTLFGLEHILQYENDTKRSIQARNEENEHSKENKLSSFIPQQAIPISKQQLQLYEYLKHALTQSVLGVLDQHPHLQFLPVSTSLGYVHGNLLPDINPYFSLDPSLTYSINKKQISPTLQQHNQYSKKINRLMQLFQHQIVSRPSLIPSALQFFSHVKEIRQKAHKIEKELLKPGAGRLSKLLQKSSMRDQIKLKLQHIGKVGGNITNIIPPIIDNPLQPHPHDFRAVLLFDSLDPEQRVIYHTLRRSPHTPYTSGQSPEYTRPGFERHPFNRAYVRTGDSNGDIYSYTGQSDSSEPISPLERQTKYIQWCHTFPEQAFNRQVIDTIKDHAYISSHPLVQQYLSRRVEYFFGSKVPYEDEENISDNTNQKDPNNASSILPKLTQHDEEYNDVKFFLSPTELEMLDLPVDFFPTDLIQHPLLIPYLAHQTQLYKSRYQIANEIVSREMSNQQARARARYMNEFKDELGLSESDIKVHTNDTKGIDDELQSTIETESQGGWFSGIVNSVRGKLGLPPTNTKEFVDSTAPDQAQWPFIFGIPLEIQKGITKSLYPKASDVVYLDHVVPTQFGDTSLPLLKPEFIIKKKKFIGLLSDPDKVIKLNVDDDTETQTDPSISDQPLYTKSYKRKEKLFKVEIQPYPEPNYIQKLSYYDQSYYLFGSNPFDADKELADKYETNKEYLVNMHSAAEYGLSYLQYLAYVNSLVLASQSTNNIPIHAKKQELEASIIEQNYLLNERLNQRRTSQFQKERLDQHQNHNKLLQSSQKNSPRPITITNNEFGSLDHDRPEQGLEEFLDQQDFVTIRYRNGLLQELESLPLLTSDGVNLSAIQSSLKERLLHTSFDPNTGTNPSTLDHQLISQITADANNATQSAFNEQEDEIDNFMSNLFSNIHGSPLSLESVETTPIIITSPTIDDVTGDEYLQHYELRRTTENVPVWKPIDFDPITGELLGDSIESPNANQSFVMEELQADGQTTLEHVVKLLPRHFTNALQVLDSGFQTNNNTANDQDYIKLGLFSNPLNQLQDKNYIVTSSGERFFRPDTQLLQVDRSDQINFSNQLTHVSFLDPAHEARNVKLAKQLRRDLPLQFELDFSDDPYLGDSFEMEFGQTYREMLWKQQDTMLSSQWEAQHSGDGQNEMLIPDHRYDYLFTGHYRDYVIHPEDSDELQEEKIKRRRLAVRPLSAPPPRALSHEDILLTPRSLSKDFTLELGFDQEEYIEELRKKQVEKQTKFELYQRSQLEAAESKKLLRQQEYQKQQEALSNQFSRFEKQPNHESQIEKILSDEQSNLQQFFSSNPQIAHQLQTHPDHYFAILSTYAKSIDDSTGSAGKLFAGMFSRESTQSHNFGQLQASINPTSSHLYNTLFQNADLPTPEQITERTQKMLEKKNKEAQEAMKQKLLQRNRALLSYGIDPKQFESAYHSNIYNDVLSEEFVANTINNASDFGNLSQLDEMDELDKEIRRNQRVNKLLTESSPSAADIHDIVFDLSDSSLFDIQTRLKKQQQYQKYLTKSGINSMSLSLDDYSPTTFQSPYQAMNRSQQLQQKQGMIGPQYSPSTHLGFDPAIDATLRNPSLRNYQTKYNQITKPKYTSKDTVYHQAIVDPYSSKRISDTHLFNIDPKSSPESFFSQDPAIQQLSQQGLKNIPFTSPSSPIPMRSHITREHYRNESHSGYTQPSLNTFE